MSCDTCPPSQCQPHTRLLPCTFPSGALDQPVGRAFLSVQSRAFTPFTHPETAEGADTPHSPPRPPLHAAPSVTCLPHRRRRRRVLQQPKGGGSPCSPTRHRVPDPHHGASFRLRKEILTHVHHRSVTNGLILCDSTDRRLRSSPAYRDRSIQTRLPGLGQQEGEPMLTGVSRPVGKMKKFWR